MKKVMRGSADPDCGLSKRASPLNLLEVHETWYAASDKVSILLFLIYLLLFEP